MLVDDETVRSATGTVNEDVRCAGPSGEPLTGIFTVVSFAVLATNNAVLLLVERETASRD